jgi:hypothetical protein
VKARRRLVVACRQHTSVRQQEFAPHARQGGGEGGTMLSTDARRRRRNAQNSEHTRCRQGRAADAPDRCLRLENARGKSPHPSA